MSDTFRIRLIKAMELRNMKSVDLVKATGLSKARISQYINGVYEAKQDALYKLAVALDVSEGWLMGQDVPIERMGLVTFSGKYIEPDFQQQLANEAEIYDKVSLIMGKEAYEVLHIFVDVLNEQGKAKALDALEDLSAIDKYVK